ncbi:MAG TPA: hypothetical protein VGG46_03650 [Terriglobales bacterium]|jgi:hypothetical protein
MSKFLQTRVAIIFILALGLFAMAARTVTDPDVWWHLRTGQLILQTHHIFHTDPYSFTRAGHAWINHEWFSQVLMFSIYRWLGYAGLIVLFAAIVAAAFFIVFLRCEARPYLAALITAWGAAASASTWGVRPQMLSLLLASIFLLLLERSSLRPRLLWWLPPLTLFWVNLHAGYALGICLIGLFLCGEILNVVFGTEAWSSVATRIKQLSLALVVCIAVVPLNPNGLRMYTYPWQTLSSSAMQQYIQEWASPNFHQALYLPLLLMVLALIAALAYSPRRLRPLDLLLLAVTLYAALRSVRHIPIFVLVAAPILSSLVYAILQQWPGKKKEETHSPAKLVFNAAIMLGIALFVFWRITFIVRSQPSAEARDFPTAAVSFLAKDHPPAPLLNHYNWGGYLIWKLYPQYRVFVDGRADLYGDDFLNRLADIYYIRHNWEEEFAATHVCSVMLPPDAPLIAALRELPNWKVIYSDKQAVILTRRADCSPAATVY